jgi:hypothetical protein
VRNEPELTHWKVEGPGRIDALNVPYCAFLEAENGSVAKVVQWLGAAPANLGGMGRAMHSGARHEGPPDRVHHVDGCHPPRRRRPIEGLPLHLRR